MISYIIRRLLLIIPTLIGITFLVFMLIALAPGGVGAALQSQGGQMEASSRALQMAYLEDRYGLNDPAVVQYVRWLGRISPIKFGSRDLVTLDGEVISAPKRLKPPPAWEFVADELPGPPPVPEHTWASADDAETPQPIADPDERMQVYKARTYRRAASEYTRMRGLFIAARTDYEAALKGYAREAGIKRATNSKGDLRPSVFDGREPDTTNPEWPKVKAAGDAVLSAFAEALGARAQVQSIFEANPFPKAGIGLPQGGLWLGAPDFGVSFSKSQPVGRLISERLPVTLMMNIVALPIIYLVAIPAGMLAATKQNSPIDVSLGVLFVALWAVPIVWAGTLAIGFLGSNDYLGWFPAGNLSSVEAQGMTFFPSRAADGSWEIGWLFDRVYHLVLPIACLVYAGFAVLSKQTRAAMLDNFSADYVRTARAKGVADIDVVFRHVFRNSLLPLITMFARVFPAMLAGSVVVEKIFNINGMGLLFLESIYLRDREVLLANILMIGTVNILALLLADLLYAVADPRISYN